MLLSFLRVRVPDLRAYIGCALRHEIQKNEYEQFAEFVGHRPVSTAMQMMRGFYLDQSISVYEYESWCRGVYDDSGLYAAATGMLQCAPPVGGNKHALGF